MAFMGSSEPNDKDRSRTSADTGSKIGGSLSSLGESIANAFGIGGDSGLQQAPKAVPQADSKLQRRQPASGPRDPYVAAGIRETANALGIDPIDLGTAISYETAGTFNPTKRGPTTQWGQHRGLIQFGEPQARKYGVDWRNPVQSQLGPDGAVAKYLKGAGVQPGMGMLDIYSAINAGRVGRYNASDANNGGAPGTVRDKVERQMAGHRRNAERMLAASMVENSGQRPPSEALYGMQKQPISPLPEQAGSAVALAPQRPSSPFHDFALSRIGGKGNLERVAGAGASLFDNMARGLGVQFGPFGPQSTPESLAALTQGIGDYNPDASMRVRNPGFGGGAVAQTAPPQARKKRLLPFNEAFPLLSNLG